MLDVLAEKKRLLAAENVLPASMRLLTEPESLGRFDIVFSSMVFHHIPDTEAELNLLRPLIKRGGKLIIIDLDTVSPAFHGNDPLYSGHHGFCREALAETVARYGYYNVSCSTAYSGTYVEKNETAPYTLFLMEAYA